MMPDGVANSGAFQGRMPDGMASSGAFQSGPGGMPDRGASSGAWQGGMPNGVASSGPSQGGMPDSRASSGTWQGRLPDGTPISGNWEGRMPPASGSGAPPMPMEHGIPGRPPFGAQVPAATKLNKHGYPIRPEATPCEFYIKFRKCKHRERCIYDHPDDLPDIQSGGLNSVGLPLRPGAPRCASWMRTGTCSYGHTCRCDHPEAEEHLKPIMKSIPTQAETLFTTHIVKNEGKRMATMAANLAAAEIAKRLSIGGGSSTSESSGAAASSAADAGDDERSAKRRRGWE
eukprot:gnl/TRDRNA2_/TRDRNA2_143508_c0_seq2.p1 gnl/TRDRNA2_/TRDRNA2_143508_c0~~gnl/TRDRNA2_/TRDRNA2_143508_c0_seq2.p1  ORF type:complete len:327 (-),score=48.62 gnl/TRDRNA2_/TRDRNA2_143508_c0_seq2:61-921(-)